jgi:hypothetical protein
MNTIAISLIEKKPHQDGGTFDHLKSIEVEKLQSNAHYIPMIELIRQSEIPVLLEIQNQQLTTILDCTNFSPYELWYFDEDFQFIGKAFSAHEESANFLIQTQAKWILFVQPQTKVFKKLKDFKCSELDLTDKYGFVRMVFPKYYGIFPYFIIKREKSPCFTQIPIHINAKEKNLPGWTVNEVEPYKLESDSLSEELLVNEARTLYNEYTNREGKSLKIALVVKGNKAFYFDEHNKLPICNEIPYGGVLLDVDGQIIANNTRHYLKNSYC